jgi:hypothetical protein
VPSRATRLTTDGLKTVPYRRTGKRDGFALVRRIGLALPGVTESTAYGSPALKINDSLIACLAVNKSAEPDTLVACVDFSDRDELLAADPDTYYLTEHYVNDPSILVRLRRIHDDALRDLLGMAYQFARTRKRRRTRAVRR